jgi:hypothetical protein
MAIGKKGERYKSQSVARRKAWTRIIKNNKDRDYQIIDNNAVNS